MRGFLACLLLAAAGQLGGAAAGEGDVDGRPEITVVNPMDGAVVPPGVLHLNYTVSHCPPRSFMTMALDGIDEDALGQGSFFWCKQFMFLAITGLELGEQSMYFILWEGDPTNPDDRVEVAHAFVHFFVKADHGRFFGVREVAIVDAAPTAALFLAPPNRSSVLLQNGAVTLKLVAQNFQPGRREYSFRVTSLSSGEEVETREHLVVVRVAPGRQCFRVSAINDQGEAVGQVDFLCLRALAHPAPDTSCEEAVESITEGLVKKVVVVDDDDCSSSQDISAWCTSCSVVLCAPWEPGAVPPGVNMSASQPDYTAAVTAKLRRISLQ
ncbi:hypothetical protein T484DRAFT_1897419, partial [Baffinella frigidus]